MAITFHSAASVTGAMNDTLQIASNTDKRDVSDLLDQWAHRDTPFLNRVSWGPDSGATSIEWLYEHLSWGYVEGNGAVGSGATTLAAEDPTGLGTAYAGYPIQEGCLLYCYGSGVSEHGLLLVESVASSQTVTFEWVTAFTASVPTSAKFYIVGNFANEGSEPRNDNSRPRALLSNTFTILRQDVQITGSQAATDFYAVENETRHQITARLLEMQFERERTCLLSSLIARSSTAASLMYGVLGFLKTQTGSHIDTTTSSLTETAVNNMVRELWENGSDNLTFFASSGNTAKFTDWDRSRVRTQPDAKVGGLHIARYMTDIGIEIDLVPIRKWPVNLGFMLDTSKIKLRAKKGRKLIVEKLGKMGDYEQWQMISEFSMEMRGYNFGQHGMFGHLS